MIKMAFSPLWSHMWLYCCSMLPVWVKRRRSVKLPLFFLSSFFFFLNILSWIYSLSAWLCLVENYIPLSFHTIHTDTTHLFHWWPVQVKCLQSNIDKLNKLMNRNQSLSPSSVSPSFSDSDLASSERGFSFSPDIGTSFPSSSTPIGWMMLSL